MIQHRETEHRQLRETESKIFQTGFNHLRKDRQNGNLDHLAVLARNKSQNTYLLHISQRDPSTYLAGNTIDSIIFRRTPIQIFAKRTKITRNPCRRNPESREDRKPQATHFGATSTADHKVLNAENESRVHHRYAVGYKIWPLQWIQSYSCRNKTAQDNWEVCSGCYLHKASLEWFTLIILCSQKLAKICRGIMTNPLHFDPKQMESPKEAIQGGKERTSTLLVQSRLDEQWWREAMKFLLFFTTQSSLFFCKWQTPKERKIRHSIPWSNKTLWIKDILSSNIHNRQGQASSIRNKSLQKFLFVPSTRGQLGEIPTRGKYGRIERQHCIRSLSRKNPWENN